MFSLSPARYTLAPLRTQGPDALDLQGVTHLQGVRLTEVEVAAENALHAVVIHRADDLFKAIALGQSPPIPKTGQITRAVLAFDLAMGSTPRLLEIIPPGTLGLPPEPERKTVQRWLDRSPFKLPAAPAP